MSSYHRPLSPGGRRIQNPARISDSVATPASYYSNPSSTSAYTNPRASTGVIPISTQTFVNLPPPSSSARTGEHRDSRPVERLDSYTGRPRRNSLLDGQRSSTAVSSGTTVLRNRPTVVQNDIARTSSPPKSTRDKEYYITPAVSTKPKTEHKKLYSVDDGTAKLVADIDVTPSNEARERHHRRRNSTERSGYKATGGDGGRSRDGRRPYHANGGTNKPRDKNIDDDDAYSYTDAVGMYRDTEPSWRPRRGSLDRDGSGVHSRERPISIAVESSYEPRTSNKDIGPPPSTRGWDKLNDNISRTKSVRGAGSQRNVAQSPTRGRYVDAGSHNDPKDPYYIPARASPKDGRVSSNMLQHERGSDSRYDQYDQYDDRREPQRERRNSVTRAADRSVERRGFGIRPSGRDPYERGSNESFEKSYVDSAYVEPHRRDTAPNIYYEEKRFDQERKDRVTSERSQNEQRDRDAREKELRRREDDRVYDRDRDHERDRDRPRDRDRDYPPDRERERERERMMEREPERERERHHYRRDTDRDRDRDYNRKENADKDTSSGLAKAATGSLAGAAAAIGLGKLINRDKDKKDDRDRDRDSDRERERDRPRDEQRDRDHDRIVAREHERGSDYDRLKDQEANGVEPRRNDVKDPERDRRQSTSDKYSDEGLDAARGDRERHRDEYRDEDRGLGFAFEGPREQQHTGPVLAERERDRDREYEDKQTAEMPQPAIDPVEDYRRRMEQVQRELALGRTAETDKNHTDVDPDRQRRREQRLRERNDRNRDSEVPPAFGIVPVLGKVGIHDIPPPPPLRQNFDDESEVSRSTELNRKPSILDMPMPAESAQIIDNSMSEKRENRVRIVDPPTDEEERKPRGILKKPTDKFPEHQNNIREGVAPLKDGTKKGIPPGARWTKIDRKLVNPESLDEAKERYEERLDCVIVLRVLTKEEIQKLADRTKELRDLKSKRAAEEEHAARKAGRRPERRTKDEYSDVDSEDEYALRAPKMLEAPSNASGLSAAGSSSWAPSSQSGSQQQGDSSRDYRDRRRESEREPIYASGGAGGRRE